MLLVDTSVWLLVARREVLLLDLIGEQEVAVCPPIVQEVLQGVRIDRVYGELREILLGSRMLESPTPLEVFEQAAQIYRRCRAAAVTIRSPFDCLIAACAIRNSIGVLHRDRDFEAIASVMPLVTRAV